MPYEEIFGLKCYYPDMPNENLIINTNNRFEKSLDIHSFIKNIQYENGEPILNYEQLKIINTECERCDNGYWFYNNNIPTYITGFYYYYLNYWTLEDGSSPEYRDADRRFFLFFQECYDSPIIIGIIRGKYRRLGASSQAACIGTKITTFLKEQKFGIVSMKDDVAEKLFKGMVYKAFYNLPFFLRPRLDSSSTNKNNFHFIETPKKGKNKTEQLEGLNSYIDYESTTLNAYDSTRQSFLLVDEAGKWTKVDITRYFEVAKECVRVGASKVGFIMMPTTVNPGHLGGDNFKILWDGSNQFEFGCENTPTNMVQYFNPAYDGLDGFIDEFGFSVIGAPDDKTLKFLIEKQNKKQNKRERIPLEYLKKGAKKYLEDEFAKLKTDEQRSDFKRKFPMIIEDMWDFGNSYSPFNLDNIRARKNYLYNNKPPLRRGDFKLIKEEIIVDGDEDVIFKVEFIDNEKGKWLIKEIPKETNLFKINKDKKVVYPLNTLNYGGGADTFRFDSTEQLGSNGTIWIGSKLDISLPEDKEGGIPVAFYIDRPKLTDLFWEEILKASLFYGCTITTEHDATQEYRKYFSNRMPNPLGLNCLPLLGKKPDEAINPERKSQNLLTTSSADPFVWGKQISLSQIYFEKYTHKIDYVQLLEEAERFQPDIQKRTKFDTLIGFMMMLLNICGETRANSENNKNLNGIIKNYSIKPTLSY